MSKVIHAEELASLERWNAPSVESPGSSRSVTESPKLPTAKELEEMQRQAYAEGFAQGRREGKEAGRRETEAEAAYLRQLIETLARPLDQLDHQVEDELIALVSTMVRQLLRRELRTEPAHVMAAVREALAVLPVGVRHVSLHLHPEDAALVGELLATGDSVESWRILEDPRLTRGGCRVVTDTSQVLDQGHDLPARLGARRHPLRIEGSGRLAG